MRAPHRLPVLAFALATLAGCVSPASLLGADALPPAPDAPAWATGPDWALRALPFETPHNHSLADQHRNLSTPNFEVLGWDPLVTDYFGASAGSYFCADVSRGGNRTVAFVHSFGTDVAFVGVDVTDPTRPTKISEFSLPNAKDYDLAVTPDGNWVALALNSDRASLGPNPPANASAPSLLDVRPASARCRDDAATDATEAGRTRVALSPAAALRASADAPQDPTPYPGGLLLVDVSDPANPRTADYWPQPAIGVHSVSTAEIDGRTIVLASALNLAHPASYWTFFEIEDGKLSPKYVYRPPPPSPIGMPLVSGHVDGTIQRHPVTGQILAYLDDFDGGLTILDVTDYSNAAIVSRWNDYDWGIDSRSDLYGSDSGNIHGVVAVEGLWDGRHYTIVGQEVGARPADSPSGKLFVLDTTDPATPAYVSAWTLPVDVPWDKQLLFSTHYPILVDRMMFLPMYHGGVWAVDLADVANPRSAGVFVPDRWAEGMPGADPRAGFSPAVLEVLALLGGTLVTFDGATGAYTLRYDPAVPIPPVVEWEILEPAG